MKTYAAALVAFPLLVTAAAHATSGKEGTNRCSGTFAPAAGESIPANAKVLTFDYAGSSGSIAPTVSIGGGAAIGFDTEADDWLPRISLLRPKSALTAGAASLTTGVTCPAEFTNDIPTTIDFTLAAAATLPTTTGTVTTKVNAFEFTPSPELAAFLPVTAFRLKRTNATGVLKDVLVANAEYGRWKGAGGVVKVYLSSGLVSGDEQNLKPIANGGLCSGTESGDVDMKLTLSAHVAGESTDPSPIDIDVKATCMQTMALPSDGGATTTPGSNPTSSSSGSPAAEGCACHAGSGGTAGFGEVALGMAGLAALVRRKRAKNAPR